MRTVKLLSWHTEVAAKAKPLARKGVTVDVTPLIRTSSAVTELAAANPAALVLDMDRLPSNCREVALMLRSSKSARHIPILFAGSLPPDGQDGLPEKYARLKAELPDIPYAAWNHAAKALGRLLHQPAAQPAIMPPRGVYTRSLAQKLGIVPASSNTKQPPGKVALVGAPKSFVELLGGPDESVKLVTRLVPGVRLAVCFVRSLTEAAAIFELLNRRLPDGASAWIAHPKKGRATVSEVTGNDVRKLGLEQGWADYKVASIDEDWSGIKFARRKL